MSVEFVVVSVPHKSGQVNQDTFIVEREGGGQPFFAAVVDGHGKSERVPDFAARAAGELYALFRRFPDPGFFPDIFDEVHERLWTEFAHSNAGAVATVLTACSSQMYLAQAGDCRLYAAISQGRGYRRLTRDHNTDHPLEIERLRVHFKGDDFRAYSHRPQGLGFPPSSAPDALFKKDAQGRFLDYILPTRAFGDWEFRPAVTHKPECRVIALAGELEDAVFALCSDGGNDIVESVFNRLKGRIRDCSLHEIEVLIHAMLGNHNDDVTIILFRWRNS